MYSSLLPLLSLAAFAHGRVFESLYETPRGWTLMHPAAPTDAVKLRLSLKQSNVDSFYAKMLDVSTPSHAHYGQHLEGDEIKALLKPSAQTSSTVLNWLKSASIHNVVDDGDWLFFYTDVATANKLLDTTFAWYRHEDLNIEALRTLEYSVPENIRDHINFVQPTTRFAAMRSLSSTAKKVDDNEQAVASLEWSSVTAAAASPAVDIACNRTITPKCLMQLYNIHYKGNPNVGNKVGFASFLEEYARYSDLTLFENKYATFAAGRNFSVVQFNGGLNDQTSRMDSGEANLDNQYVLSIGFDTPVTEFSTGGRGLLIPDGDTPNQADNSNEPYLDFLLALLKLPNSQIPQTISVSYGENEQEIPFSYATQVCQLFAQLGARGTTVLFSSGDSGTGDFCLSNDGKNTTRFQPQFPAACPYVTSVGGTRYISPERATYFSSGGFSNYFPRPAYQALAVPSYLQKIGDHNKGYYNPNGRGFPDVAAQSYNFRVFDKGSDVGFQGTSCASPAFAGVVALLNSARLSNKLPPLGFLNPWLYAIGKDGLNDVTVGAGTGCNGMSRFNGGPNGSPVIPGASWNATTGWDAVTGFGTPDLGKLLKLSTPFVSNTGGVLPA